MAAAKSEGTRSVQSKKVRLLLHNFHQFSIVFQFYSIETTILVSLDIHTNSIVSITNYIVFLPVEKEAEKAPCSQFCSSCWRDPSGTQLRW